MFKIGRKEAIIISKLIKSFLLIALLCVAPSLANAKDIEDFSARERDAFCQGLWKVAKSSAEERDNGDSENAVLERLEAALVDSPYGWKYQHVMRTTVKGAFLRIEENPREYAANVQLDCQKMFP